MALHDEAQHEDAPPRIDLLDVFAAITLVVFGAIAIDSYNETRMGDALMSTVAALGALGTLTINQLGKL